MTRDTFKAKGQPIAGAQGGGEVKCPQCYGSGDYCLAGHSAHPDNWRTCETCKGTGTAPPSEPAGVDGDVEGWLDRDGAVWRRWMDMPHNKMIGARPLYTKAAQQPAAVDGATLDSLRNLADTFICNLDAEALRNALKTLAQPKGGA